MTTTNLTAEQTAEVLNAFKVYQNEGTAGTGLWVYQPHDYDSSFDLWSDTFATRDEAIAAAFAEMGDPSNHVGE